MTTDPIAVKLSRQTWAGLYLLALVHAVLSFWFFYLSGAPQSMHALLQNQQTMLAQQAESEVYAVAWANIVSDFTIEVQNVKDAEDKLRAQQRAFDARLRVFEQTFARLRAKPKS